MSPLCVYATSGSAEFISQTSLLDILNIDITVASGAENKLTSRQSPGIVTVLTREDIMATGASTFFDLMRYVPGYDVGADTFSVPGLIVRGNAAAEGKVLLNINGMPVNENGLETITNSADLNYIERIEIIRGPGSALYGGSAELGVINIITREMTGNLLVAMATNQEGGDLAGYTSTSIMAGKVAQNRSELGVNVFANFREADPTEGAYEVGDNYIYSSLRAPATYPKGEDYHQHDEYSILLNGSGGGFYFDFYHYNKDYRFPLSDRPDYIGDFIYVDDVTNKVYSGTTGRVGYKTSSFDHLTVDGSVQYGLFDSFQTSGSEVLSNDTLYFDIPTEKVSGALSFNYVPPKIDNTSWDFGVGYTRNRAKISDKMHEVLLERSSVNEDEFGILTFDNHYAYLQGIVEWGDLIFTVGARTEENDGYGNITVPRAAMTYVNGPFHFKLLTAKAYKAPALFNSIVKESHETNELPERNQNHEVEVGYLFNDQHQVQINVFDNTIEDAIAFDNDSYENLPGEYRTQGYELTYKFVDTWGFVTLNASQHWLPSEPTVPRNRDIYSAAIRAEDRTIPEKKLFGSAETQLSLFGVYRFSDRISISPSLNYFGERYSIAWRDDFNTATVVKVEPTVVANLFIHSKDLFFKGLEGALGVTNLNEGEDFYTVYYFEADSTHRPGLGRRIDLRLKYTF